MSKDNMPFVFVSKTSPLKGLERLRQHCKVEVHENDDVLISAADFKKAVVGTDALFVHPPVKVDKEVLDVAGDRLKVVGTMSVGLDHIDLEECKRRGIQVGYTPHVLTKAVAEMALALTLATARRIQEGFQSVHDGVWGTRWENALWLAGMELNGSVVGIVGLGRIGLETAKRFKAFEPSRIVYCGHSQKSSAEDIGAEYVSFDELLRVSDFVIAMCSINKENAGLFNAGAFEAMKKSSIFVNMTRGSLVVQEDLYHALVSGEILAAGLDVTTPEPLPADHKLLSLPNCVVTPHLGSATVKTRNAMCQTTVDNILAGLNGHPVPFSAY